MRWDSAETNVALSVPIVCGLYIVRHKKLEDVRWRKIFKNSLQVETFSLRTISTANVVITQETDTARRQRSHSKPALLINHIAELTAVNLHCIECSDNKLPKARPNRTTEKPGIACSCTKLLRSAVDNL